MREKCEERRVKKRECTREKSERESAQERSVKREE